MLVFIYHSLCAHQEHRRAEDKTGQEKSPPQPDGPDRPPAGPRSLY